MSDNALRQHVLAISRERMARIIPANHAIVAALLAQALDELVRMLDAFTLGMLAGMELASAEEGGNAAS